MRSKRFEVLDARPVNQDGFVAEWPEVGLIAMDGPNDPKPSITIENGVVVELDGKRRADFDMLDTFIATYGIKTQGESAPIRSLSGGNVQRALLARELDGQVDVLLCLLG